MSLLQRWNSLPIDEAEAAILACCGSKRWAKRIAVGRPYESDEQFLKTAHSVWWGLGREDWLEAYASHPRIGEVAAAHASNQMQTWSEQEQSAARTGDSDAKIALAIGNRRYEERFGYKYLVCATGKTSQELLSILQSRLSNEPGPELLEAAREQAMIMNIRLKKWLES